MMRGVVTDGREAVMRLIVLGSRRRHRKIEAVIDTGFDGWLSLPPALIRSLRLQWHTTGRAILADGSESVFDIYTAAVGWDRGQRRILVHEADATPLIGMALLGGHELNMQIRPRGKVTIKRLKQTP